MRVSKADMQGCSAKSLCAIPPRQRAAHTCPSREGSGVSPSGHQTFGVAQDPAWSFGFVFRGSLKRLTRRMQSSFQRATSFILALVVLLTCLDGRRAIANTDLLADVTPATREAIDRGLAYLVQRQERQGSWTNNGGIGEYPVAMTALAGFALLMDGNTTTQGRYAINVDRATNFLLRSSTPSGLFTRGEADARPMHGHGFALMYLSQLLGNVEDPDRARSIHEVLTRGIKLTAESQSPLGGWMYFPDARNDEGSVTITQVQALRACRNVGLAVPKSVIDEAMEYLVKSQNSDGGIRYAAGMQGPSRPAITAAAVCCWFNAGEYTNPLALKALAFSKDQIKPYSPQGGHDFYAQLYYSQALFVSSDPDWAEYYRKRRDFLLAQQLPDGSWEGDMVGDIYGTSLALMLLQLPFQLVPIMQR